MIAANSLQLTVVTPETTLLSETALQVQFPLEDGQIGVLPNRAPLVGRMGTGELLVTTASGKTSYFVDGGFAQVKGDTVTLLTNDALKLDNIKRDDIQKQYEEASSRKAITDTDVTARDHDADRARKLLSLLDRRK
ncbi:MAG: ATP synthase F1 subunit epsilon [Rubinisphaera brasiliensis]|uniref:ATP synthase epsilon chain n=1 Tax=Rubinisphaera brasiliensis (strain ATCC 49424 / DSM 5305 / JCM 21570 / IAM 15109 / NBRC 103401 / IFAM 1448) TaxID=756272 RepID=F0SLR9_RUBBR|nr:ATP synthase F1 subunit epsilon [Rubinisphaera brasiliensis]ADY58810.1 ATP synthase epsilon chain [Rubinisphaera brasiliensis DSM 5305]MBB01931.1 ATP synthase F1 subunit epsilon [Planctomyces sp.]MBR9800617.1 ATP synthase F1 subunit epsilon [bacterium]